MDARKRNIITISSILVVGGVSYLLYRKAKGHKESTALIDYIDKQTYTQTDISKGGQEAIAHIQSLKIDPTKIHVGSLNGDYFKTKGLADALAKANSDMYLAMKGVGTDEKMFYDAFFKIRNKNTMALADAVFKSAYKKGLFEMMKDKVALNNSQYGMFNDKQTLLSNIPFMNSYWNPVISAYLQALTDYK